MAGKYNKQDGSHLGFPIRMILATVDLQVTLILPMNFESIALSVQENMFKMAAIAAIWDFLSQRFELFLIYKSPRCFLPSFESTGLSVQKKKGKNDFQDGCHLGFPIGTILAIFISTSHPDAACQFSNQLALWFRKKAKKKKRVSRWPTWRPSWISDPNNLSYFKSTSHPNASYQVSSQMAFQFRRSEK